MRVEASKLSFEVAEICMEPFNAGWPQYEKDQEVHNVDFTARQAALHGHHPPTQLEFSYKNCKVMHLFGRSSSFCAESPEGTSCTALNARAMIISQLPPTLRGRGGGGSYCAVVTGESESKLAGQKWGWWHAYFKTMIQDCLSYGRI